MRASSALVSATCDNRAVLLLLEPNRQGGELRAQPRLAAPLIAQPGR